MKYMLEVENISMAPKSHEVSLMHQNMLNKEHAMQQNIQGSFEHQIWQNGQQTVKMTKSENKGYLYDAKNKGNGQEERHKRKKQKGEDKEEKNPQIKMSSFDIKI